MKGRLPPTRVKAGRPPRNGMAARSPSGFRLLPERRFLGNLREERFEILAKPRLCEKKKSAMVAADRTGLLSQSGGSLGLLQWIAEMLGETSKTRKTTGARASRFAVRAARKPRD